MQATLGQSHDVVQAAALGIWPWDLLVDGDLADVALPTVPLSDVGEQHRLTRRCSLLLGAPAVIAVPSSVGPRLRRLSTISPGLAVVQELAVLLAAAALAMLVRLEIPPTFRERALTWRQRFGQPLTTGYLPAPLGAVRGLQRTIGDVRGALPTRPDGRPRRAWMSPCPRIACLAAPAGNDPRPALECPKVNSAGLALTNGSLARGDHLT